MIEYRRARPEEREAYLTLADRVFQSVGANIAFAQALPKVYAPDRDTAHMQHVAVDDERGIVGLVAVLPGRLHVLDRVLKTGYIGTVCVDQKARGEGHMKALMAQAMADMREQGVDVALLGGQRQRYEHFGYAKGGVMYSVEISRSNVRHGLAAVDTAGVTLSELRSGTPQEQACEAMHRRRRYWFERDEAGFAQVCRSYYYTPWVFERAGRVIGWCVADREKKHLAEVWAEDTARDLPAMLKVWMAGQTNWAVTIDVPQSDWELLILLNGLAEQVSCTGTLSVQILNYPRVVEAMLRLKADYCGLADGEMACVCAGQAFTVRKKGGSVTVTEGITQGTDPIRLPEGPTDRLWVDALAQNGPAGWLPLPFFSAEADAF